MLHMRPDRGDPDVFLIRLEQVSEDGGRTWTEKLFMMQPTRTSRSTAPVPTTTRLGSNAASREAGQRGSRQQGSRAAGERSEKANGVILSDPDPEHGEGEGERRISWRDAAKGWHRVRDSKRSFAPLRMTPM
jgi:hypothetical protein